LTAEFVLFNEDLSVRCMAWYPNLAGCAELASPCTLGR
jgi:hypothetical protein